MATKIGVTAKKTILGMRTRPAWLAAASSGDIRPGMISGLLVVHDRGVPGSWQKENGTKAGRMKEIDYRRGKGNMGTAFPITGFPRATEWAHDLLNRQRREAKMKRERERNRNAARFCA